VARLHQAKWLSNHALCRHQPDTYGAQVKRSKQGKLLVEAVMQVGSSLAVILLAATGADALMIGRGAFGRPWLFREIAHFLATGNVLPAPDAGEWSEIVLAHLDDIHAFHGEQAGVRFARKHIGWYVHGMPGGEVLRDQVNQACTIAAQRAAVEAWCAVLQARERRGAAPAPVASRPVYNNHRTSAGRERPRLEEIHR
jgi:hypothetical protein